MNTKKRASIFEQAIIVFMVTCFALPATAGNKAMVAPNGVGKVEASISFNGVLSEAKNPAGGVSGTDASVLQPAAGVAAGNPDIVGKASLPPGCPSSVYCTVTTTFVTGGYKAVVRAYVTGGAVADNPALVLKLPIDPANCASYDVEASTEVVGPNAGQLVVTGQASAGAAVWFRAFEFNGIPADRDEVITNGILKYEMVMAGPFDYTNGCPLKAPFPFSGDLTKLYITTDAVAKSVPFVVACPANMVVNCGEPVLYPLPTVVSGGCDLVYASYDPPTNSLTLGSNQVTVTVFDLVGNTNTCTFNVKIQDTNAPVITGCPANIITNTGPGRITCDQVATWTPPTANDNCNLVSFTSTHSPGATFPVGTTTVTYTAMDGAGNTSTCSFDVKVVDNTPPKLPVLPTLTGQCGASLTLPVPTTTDNCGGLVTVSPNVPQVFNTSGTNRVLWTFSDAAGNNSSAYQTGIVASLSFKGFYAPIGASNNACANTTIGVNRGNTTPIKFDLLCGTSYITAGQTPIIKVEEFNKNCERTTRAAQLLPAEYQNDWHNNGWDTSSLTKGFKYRISVSLPNGPELGYVWVVAK